ncbi:MAG: pilus assembly protein PilM [Proteobacteria bacterium]|nr:pilus assembly protein PilM [Pseudomonadota bacterium]
MKRKVTGIDFGSKTIKIVSTKFIKNRISVDKALIIEKPKQIGNEKDYKVNFSLVNESARRKGISLNNVAICCPNNLYTSVNLVLPKMKKQQDIKSAILWELKDRYGMEPTEINFDYFINDISEDQKIEYQIYFVDKKSIEEIQKEAQKFNINIKYINIDHVAYAICFNNLYTQDENIKVLLDIGYQKSIIIFLSKDKILFMRELGLGLINIINQLTEEEIRNMKIKGISGYDNENIKNYITEVLFEISKTIDYFINGLKYPGPTSIFCNGGFFSIPGIFQFFKDNLPYPVILNNVLKLANYEGEYKNFGYIFHLALGVSIL